MRARIAAAVLSVLLLAPVLWAQVAFEVASINPNISGAFGRYIEYTADSLRSSNVTLVELIQSAYGVRDDRLSGGPGWVRTARFDVNAKAARALPREQLRLMAQRLLQDRFGLVLTREKRQQPVYELRLRRSDGRTGPDLHRAPDECVDGPADRPIPRSSTGAAPTTHGRCTTMATVATALSRTLRAEVVDQTGLPGRWDWVLVFSELAVGASPAANPVQTDLPTIFVAVQEQLGLTLERNARGSVEYVVIAAARPPAGN